MLKEAQKKSLRRPLAALRELLRCSFIPYQLRASKSARVALGHVRSLLQSFLKKPLNLSGMSSWWSASGQSTHASRAIASYCEDRPRQIRAIRRQGAGSRLVQRFLNMSRARAWCCCLVLLALSCPATLLRADADSQARLDAQAILTGTRPGGGEQARSTLTKLANQGDMQAARILATALFSGRGLHRDVPAAIAWWQVAANRGDIDSAYNTGLLLLQMSGPMPGQMGEAERWLRMAAEKGDVLAGFVLGTALAETDTLAATSEAQTWLELAARNGYAPAQFNLAQLLVRDTPTPAQHEQARSWLSAAATTFAPAARALQNLAPQSAQTDVATLEPKPAPTTADSTGLAWIRNQPANYFTLQVGTGTSGPALDALLARYVPERDSVWFLHRPKSREPYTGLVGTFSNYAQAEQALATLAPALRRNAPMIRRFRSLWREIGVSPTPNVSASQPD
jgi:TPR repeat protein